MIKGQLPANLEDAIFALKQSNLLLFEHGSELKEVVLRDSEVSLQPLAVDFLKVILAEAADFVQFRKSKGAGNGFRSIHPCRLQGPSCQRARGTPSSEMKGVRMAPVLLPGGADSGGRDSIPPRVFSFIPWRGRSPLFRR